MNAPFRPADRLLRRREVEELVGLKRSAIYDRMDKATFPRPVKLQASRSVRWRSADITAWIESNPRS